MVSYLGDRWQYITFIPLQDDVRGQPAHRVEHQYHYSFYLVLQAQFIVLDPIHNTLILLMIKFEIACQMKKTLCSNVGNSGMIRISERGEGSG